MYCFQGVGRSLDNTRQLLEDKHGIGVSQRTLARYSSKYCWVERANKYDEYQAYQLQKEHEKEQVEYFNKRKKMLDAYHTATDATLNELMVDLGLVENKETGRIEKNKYIKTTSVANSLSKLCEANLTNTRLGLRLLGLPETIRDTQDITVDGNLNTENKTIQTNTVYNVEKTSKEVFEKQLEYIDKMIQKSKENNATQNNKRNN